MEKQDKLHILSESEGSSVPFLRGILTRSLQKTGLSFEIAYGIASGVRSILEGAGGISTKKIRKTVAIYLQDNGYSDFVDAYMKVSVELPRLTVVTSDGADSPFSKGQLADSLEICALPREQIYEVVTAIETEMLVGDRTMISTKQITARVLELLRVRVGAETAEIYQRWVDFSHADKPLIILVGGTTGSGKSSISSELAHRLDIVRTQSTDMLREVMRLMVPPRLLPTLHASSFEAYTSLPTAGSNATEAEMIAGYLTQSGQVAVGVEGVLGRTANEQVSLILEGVHLHPEFMHQIEQETGALVVPVILAVIKPKRLKKRLVGRGHAIQSRRSERYLESFQQIWDLQSFLLSEADTHNVSIVENDDEEQTVRTILQIISAHLKREVV